MSRGACYSTQHFHGCACVYVCTSNLFPLNSRAKPSSGIWTDLSRSLSLSLSMAGRLWASRAASYLKISVFHRGFSTGKSQNRALSNPTLIVSMFGLSWLLSLSNHLIDIPCAMLHDLGRSNAKSAKSPIHRNGFLSFCPLQRFQMINA